MYLPPKRITQMNVTESSDQISTVIALIFKVQVKYESHLPVWEFPTEYL